MPPKECPPGKIVNPATGRCVKVDGKIGKKLAAAAAAAPAPKKTVTPKKKKAVKKNDKQAILEKIKTTCNNDADPISMDNFSDMNLEQLNSLVYLGNKSKKNCYLLENIYELYKTAVMSKKDAKDPMDPSHILTNEEIASINAKMKALDPTYKPPKYKEIRPYPKGYELSIDLSIHYPNYFSINVMKNNQVKYDLGIVPGWVETHHTNSADYTSGVLLSNIRQSWEKGKFMDSVQSCCNIELRKSFNYWQSNWRVKFIRLCDQVKNLIE